MLGKFSQGMTVNIPVTFQSGGKVIDMENVTIGIQYFDKNHRRLIHALEETKMNQLGVGKYEYNFPIPPNAAPGNYIVHIQAKEPGAISSVHDHTDSFHVLDDSLAPENAVREDKPEPSRKPAADFVPSEDPPEEFDINKFKIDQINTSGKSKLIEDIVVDVFNEPIKGCHINAFMKEGFDPRGYQNMKVGSAVSDGEGKWRMSLPAGEYVFEYQAINKRKNREFRKV